MKPYIGVKLVKAEPMTYHEAGELGLIRDYDPESENMAGYKVAYGDGYVSWSPRNVFNKYYKELTDEEYSKFLEADKENTSFITRIEIIFKDNKEN